VVVRPNENEMAAHEHVLALLDKASGGRTVWRKTMSNAMTKLNSSLPEWSAMAAHAGKLAGAHLRDLDAADPQRWQNFHVEHDAWLLDISRQRITRETLAGSWTSRGPWI